MARPILAVVGLLTMASVGWADSLTPRGAEGLARADISVVIGGGLDRENPSELQLFCADAERASRFEAALRSAMSARLRADGIAVVPGSKSGFGVAIYGRPVEARNCSGRYAVLIELGISNERYADSSQPVAQRSVLETPAGADLEAAIQARVMLWLDDVLRNRRSE